MTLFYSCQDCRQRKLSLIFLGMNRLGRLRLTSQLLDHLCQKARRNAVAGGFYSKSGWLDEAARDLLDFNAHKLYVIICHQRNVRVNPLSLFS